MAAGDLIGIRFKSTKGHWLVHPDLRDRMIEEATEKGTNLGDLAVRILCQRFGVEYKPNQRKSSPRASADQFNFRMPPELERVIAATYPRDTADGIRLALCGYYGLRMPAKVKQTRRRRPPRVATA